MPTPLIYDSLSGGTVGRPILASDTAFGSGCIQSGALGKAVVLSGHIGNAAVVSGNVASGQVGWPHLSSGAVRSGHIGTSAVVSDSIASGQVGWPHIGPEAIQSGHISSGAIINRARGVLVEQAAGVTMESTSGLAVAIVRESGGYVYPADPTNPITMPAVGLLVKNVSQGQTAMILQEGSYGVYLPDALRGQAVYVGRSGLLNIGIPPASGIIQRIGWIKTSDEIIVGNTLTSGDVNAFRLASGAVRSGHIALPNDWFLVQAQRTSGAVSGYILFIGYGNADAYKIEYAIHNHGPTDRRLYMRFGYYSGPMQSWSDEQEGADNQNQVKIGVVPRSGYSIAIGQTTFYFNSGRQRIDGEYHYSCYVEYIAAWKYWGTYTVRSGVNATFYSGEPLIFWVDADGYIASGSHFRLYALRRSGD